LGSQSAHTFEQLQSFIEGTIGVCLVLLSQVHRLDCWVWRLMSDLEGFLVASVLVLREGEVAEEVLLVLVPGQ